VQSLGDHCPFTKSKAWCCAEIIPQQLIWDVRPPPPHPSKTLFCEIDGFQSYLSKDLPLVVDDVYITRLNDPLTGLLLDRGLGGHYEEYGMSFYPDFVTPPRAPLLYFLPIV
jgi:hypothetical protein